MSGDSEEQARPVCADITHNRSLSLSAAAWHSHRSDKLLSDLSGGWDSELGGSWDCDLAGGWDCDPDGG
eukprot:1732465-Rhodomonas_salina.1